MSYSFNLLERPWIPCLTRQGAAVPLSLRETLARAHELLNITHESPLVGVSVMRLVLAVLHRVYGPRDAAAWATLWRSPSFDMVALDGYFDQWRGRFDLFDAERPFYQDASIPRCLAGPVGCLNVFGISARHHVVGLFGAQRLADAAFQLFQGGMGTGR